MNGLVSVIVPCYRQARYLPDAMESVLRQTHRRIEVIVIDDGSPDDVAGAMAPFLHDPRVSLYRQPNQGVSATRNRGLELAQGEFIQFLDADDLMTPDKLELQVAMLDSDPDAAVAYCDFYEVDIETGRYALNSGDEIRSLETDGLTALWAYCPYPPVVPLLRRTWADRTGPFRTDLSYAEDFEYWVRMMLLGARMRRVDACLATYRRHGTSTTATYGEENEHEVLVGVRRDLSDSHPELVAMASVRAFAYLVGKLWELRNNRVELESAKEQIARKEAELVKVHAAYSAHVAESSEAYADLRAEYDRVVAQLTATPAPPHAAPQRAPWRRQWLPRRLRVAAGDAEA